MHASTDQLQGSLVPTRTNRLLKVGSALPTFVGASGIKHPRQGPPMDTVSLVPRHIIVCGKPPPHAASASCPLPLKDVAILMIPPLPPLSCRLQHHFPSTQNYFSLQLHSPSPTEDSSHPLAVAILFPRFHHIAPSTLPSVRLHQPTSRLLESHHLHPHPHHHPAT
jgi:hypothetical protein